jgi:elongation factor 1 alpha-like protein
MAKPLRMSVADVYKAQRLGPMTVSGRIQTGTLVVGDQLRVMPINELCTVKAMSDHQGVPTKAAIAGTNVEVGLMGLDDEAMLHAGCLLCDPFNSIPVVRKFDAQVQTLEALGIPIVKGSQLTMHVHNTDVPVAVTKLHAQCDRMDPTVIKRKKPRRIGRDEIARVRIEVAKNSPGICLEKYEDFRALGRVLLRDNGVTVGMGFVTKLKQ